ncbi:MAG TPA: hypothetical protein VI583_14805, partial [Cyclobacteriaceae bacterium]|nr:hypothetical protein [Cyclobacteriaceae bacterium]
MRILIVTINSSKLNFNPAILKDFADKEEIDIRDGLESGKEFIINYLVNQKKHVDFIIISRESSSYFYEWNQNDEEANIDTFAIWLRKLNECYSSDNFQIKSIPLILNDCETYHKSISILSFQNLYYDLILDINSIHPDYILYHLGRPINNWINKLGDELDNLDLDTSFNFEKSIIKKKDSHDLKILSKNFIDRCQKLNYVWIGDNINKLYINVDKLKEMFKISILNPNLRNEKEYHRFFLSNKGILLRDQYYETI